MTKKLLRFLFILIFASQCISDVKFYFTFFIISAFFLTEAVFNLFSQFDYGRFALMQIKKHYTVLPVESLACGLQKI